MTSGYPNDSSTEMAPTRRPTPSLHGHSDAEASADQPGQLGRPRPRPTEMEVDSEDRHSDLGSQPHHHRQSRTRDSQIPTAPTSQRQNSTSPDLPTLLADVPDTSRPCRTSLYQLQHSDYISCCPLAQLCLILHVDNKH
ncbi:hypothetical protein SprV_0100418100 [Sparganum proliferum]